MIASAPADQPRRKLRPAAALAWQIDVPLLPNRLMFLATLKIFGLACLLTWGLVAVPLTLQGDTKAIPPLLGLMAAISVGLVVVGYLAAVALYRNRLTWRYAVTQKHALIARADRRASAVDALTVGLGVLTGKPGAVGTGILSATEAHSRIAWRAVARVTPYPSQHAIALANVWRTTAVLYCPAERYEEILAYIRARVAAAPATKRASPLPGLLLRSVLVLAAAVPLFLLPVKIDGFAPYFTLCFALAAVWLLPTLAWAVVGGLGWIAITATLASMETWRSPINGHVYRQFELFSGDDLACITLALAGAAFLLWLSVALLRGHVGSGLATDLEEAED